MKTDITMCNWRQEEIVLSILNRHAPTAFTTSDICAHIKELGHPPRKYKANTIRAVLSRLYKTKKIQKKYIGYYFVPLKFNGLQINP